MNLTFRSAVKQISKCQALLKTNQHTKLSTFSVKPCSLTPTLRIFAGNRFYYQHCFTKNLPVHFTSCHYATNAGGMSPSNVPDPKPSLYQRFKLMYKEYWYILLPVHLVTSSMWLGGFYYLAISGVDIATLLELSGGPDSWVQTIRESKAGGIVTAYTMYKIATPARYTVTLGGTTVSINYLKKWGWIKPMPSKDQLKVMYDQRKTALKDKMTTTKDEIKDEFNKTKSEITQHMKGAQTGFKQSVADTKQGLKEGVMEAADEWRHVGKLIGRNVKKMVKPQKESK